MADIAVAVENEAVESVENDIADVLAKTAKGVLRVGSEIGKLAVRILVAIQNYVKAVKAV